MRGSRVLVTGGGGFIASKLIERLADLGAEVTATVRTARADRLAVLADAIQIVPWDIREPAPPGLADTNFDFVFHLAAAGVHPGEHGAVDLMHSNVVGTVRLLELAQEHAVKRFVHVGSCFEYGAGVHLTEDSPLAPIGEYASSKAASVICALAWGRRTGMPVAVARPFTVYGPGEAAQRLVPFAASSAIEGREMKLTRGEQSRDFVYIADAVDALLAIAIAPDAVGEVINIATGIETTVRALVEMILQTAASSVVPQFGAHPYRANEIFRLSGDPSRALRLAGWRPTTSLADGIRSVIDWTRERPSS